MSDLSDLKKVIMMGQDEILAEKSMAILSMIELSIKQHEQQAIIDAFTISTFAPLVAELQNQVKDEAA